MIGNRYYRFNGDDWDEIYNLKGQLDCHVFDECLNLIKDNKKLNLSPELSKRHFDLTFAGYMCHYKGNDKQARNFNYSRAKRL